MILNKLRLINSNSKILQFKLSPQILEYLKSLGLKMLREGSMRNTKNMKISFKINN